MLKGNQLNIGKTILLIGLALVVVGVLVLDLERVPWLVAWFGRLPGDIRYQGERTFIFLPVTSMVLVSLALSVLLYVVRGFH
jgi:hypothetical protein